MSYYIIENKFDKTLSDCPECGSNKISHSLFLTVNISNQIDFGTKGNKPPEEKCNICGFRSNERFETLNKIKRRDEKINKILDK